MADANPVKMGVPTEAAPTRDTGRPVRAGLVQDRNEDGTPKYHPQRDTDIPISANRESNKNKNQAEINREGNFANGLEVGEDTDPS